MQIPVWVLKIFFVHLYGYGRRVILISTFYFDLLRISIFAVTLVTVSKFLLNMANGSKFFLSL